MTDTLEPDQDRSDDQALGSKQTLKYAQDLAQTYEALKESEKRYRTLWHLSETLHQHINRDDLILQILKKTQEAINADAASVIFHDEITDKLVFVLWNASTGRVTKLTKPRFPDGHGIVTRVLKSGKPEIISDASGKLRHHKRGDTLIFDADSAIVAPLQIKEKTFGTLEVLNNKSGPFNEKNLFFLTTLAPVVAMALDNARLYAELDNAYKELQITDEMKDTLIKDAREENVRLRQAIEKRYRLDRIIGNSDQMLEVFRLCEKVTASDITILLQGETGTGKEILARAIHHNSPRKERVFVTQNCGGIPDTLLASELFGHKKGAFTGAVSDKKGLFEIAHGGTVFLDEVAETSAVMQTSLLRVLQDGEIKSLGSDYSKKVDVRVISATHRDLAEDVKTGRFREDLYYRLNTFTIKLPPLRERIGDIPILAKHFIEKYDQKTKKSIKGISQSALRCLEAYPFPGNVRELENEMERAVALADREQCIEAFLLSEKISSISVPEFSEIEKQGTLKQMIETLEKSVLEKTIKKHGGNKTRAANELGMSRYGLTKKMSRYGLSP